MFLIYILYTFDVLVINSHLWKAMQWVFKFLNCSHCLQDRYNLENERKKRKIKVRHLAKFPKNVKICFSQWIFCTIENYFLILTQTNAHTSLLFETGLNCEAVKMKTWIKYDWDFVHRNFIIKN